MPTAYYNSLLQTIQPELGEIPQLQYDIQNAPPAMREISTKLFNVATVLTYHVVALTEELVRLNVLQRTRPAVAQAPQAPQPAQQTLSPFPAPPVISLPRLTSPSLASAASPGDVTPCDVPQVVITTSGTRVIPAAGSGLAPAVLPPHTPVNLAQVRAPLAPPPIPDGVSQVVLPRGGAMPPEVQVALAARQGETP
jgi:hypothetical protein